MKAIFAVTVLALLLAGCASGGAPSGTSSSPTSTPSQPTPSTSPAVSLASASNCTVSVEGSDALVNYQGQSAGSLCSGAVSTGISLPGDSSSYSYLSLPDNPKETVVCQLRAASDGTTATVMDTGGELVGENLCAYILQY
ncbi:MAG TPA: hypothetical protein VMW80_02635 [Candidatus Dormibacteraeota bacterium]|nr:hypothetical protein [Candidatus Dormibacteraeota bacterium]